MLRRFCLRVIKCSFLLTCTCNCDTELEFQLVLQYTVTVTRIYSLKIKLVRLNILVQMPYMVHFFWKKIASQINFAKKELSRFLRYSNKGLILYVVLINLNQLLKKVGTRQTSCVCASPSHK